MTWIAPRATLVDEPFVGSERASLDGFLDRQRAALLLSCAGLTARQLTLRAAPPSRLSLQGLVRHAAQVERTWFRIRFAGAALPPVRAEDDFDTDPDTAERDLALLRSEQDAARAAVRDLPLETIYRSPRWGDMQLRWGYSHLIAEYARHCGHADLLRERIDGVVND